jgi:biopolymer transport protein ExbD
LVASLVLALIMPIIPTQLDINNTSYLGHTIQKFSTFRSYYEEIILITDPEFEVSKNEKSITQQLTANNSQTVPSSFAITKEPSFNWSKLIFYTYIAGLLFFSIRLLLLFYNLYRIIRKNKTIQTEGVTIVSLKEDTPSFSFMRWVFINKEALKPEEFEQVLSHEKVHVKHKHSVDLLLAHIITILQWFNPLTWRIQKSLKTCHEYIADRQVIDQGHELFDYQSLLLSQLISIRSVELVNNFNLLSIKKRIAMMNKIKSGRIAKLKALLVIPILMFAFFFFTNMTGNSLNHLIALETEHNDLLQGHWVNRTVKSDHPQILEFRSDKFFTILSEKGNSASIIEYVIQNISSSKLTLKNGEKLLEIPYKLNKDKLEIEWNDGKWETYRKDLEHNTYILGDQQVDKLNVPSAKSVKTYDREYVLLNIKLTEENLYLNGEMENIDKLSSLLKEIKSSADTKKLYKMTMILEIDETVKMNRVDQVKSALRKNDLLKIGYIAKPKDEEMKGRTALFMLLPPKDAKLVDEAKIKNLFEIKDASGTTTDDYSKKLSQYIRDKKKYVMLYAYTDNTTYKEYLEKVDMVFSTIHSAREEKAQVDGKNYKTLSKDELKEYRKRYPITLTMKNVDHE